MEFHTGPPPGLNEGTQHSPLTLKPQLRMPYLAVALRPFGWDKNSIQLHIRCWFWTLLEVVGLFLLKTNSFPSFAILVLCLCPELGMAWHGMVCQNKNNIYHPLTLRIVSSSFYLYGIENPERVVLPPPVNIRTE